MQILINYCKKCLILTHYVYFLFSEVISRFKKCSLGFFYLSVTKMKVLEMETRKKTNKKFWKPPSFEDFNVPLPNKKIKLDDSFEEKVLEIPDEPHEPKTVSELAIHPKKIEEIKNWIKWSSKSKAPILLVTGPAGCGKTTTLKLSANEEGVFIKEWINPVDKTDYKTETIFQNEPYDKFSFSETKQTDKFDDFVFRSSRYKSLFEDDENLLILVEDIPNIFVWRPKLFHEFLERYKNNGKSPIVFILTDEQNLNLINSLFPNHLKSKYDITNIKFNPVNHSSLSKNLKALCDIYSSEKVSSQFLETIIKNSGGDLRSATNDLFMFLRTSAPSINQVQNKGKKTKRNEGLGSGCNPLSEKDINFDFYHILGRILYPKLVSEKDNKNPHQIFVHDVHQIAQNWSGSFLQILYENYLHTFTKLKDFVEGAECFSFCDVLDNNQELEKYVSLIGVITLMLKNTEPKKTGFNPLKKTFKLELNNPESDVLMENQLFGCQLSRRDFLLDVNPFSNILKVNNMNEEKIKEDCDEYNEDMMEIEEFDD